jgi:hypothetical protein
MIEVPCRPLWLKDSFFSGLHVRWRCISALLNKPSYHSEQMHQLRLTPYDFGTSHGVRGSTTPSIIVQVEQSAIRTRAPARSPLRFVHQTL